MEPVYCNKPHCHNPAAFVIRFEIPEQTEEGQVPMCAKHARQLRRMKRDVKEMQRFGIWRIVYSTVAADGSATLRRVG